MNVEILQGHKAPPDPGDVHIAIDVLRAFTVTHCAFLRGVERIRLAATPEEAFELRRRHPEWLLAGEVDGLPIPGFDMGNSPSEVLARDDLAGRTIVLRTTNGVRAALNALEAPAVLATGFTASLATARYVHGLERQGRAGRVVLIASHPRSDEDLACAEWIRDLLLQTARPDPAPVIARMRASESAAKFLDPERPEFDPRDLDAALSTPTGGFAMAVIRTPEPVLVRVE